MYTYNDLLKDIKNANINSTDTIIIHSSYKSLGDIEGGGQTVINAFKEALKDGLLLFPTHTWGSIQQDGQVMDKSIPNSNVGYLTNLAILDKSFVRSNHPTHSVCACGANALEYIKDDDFAQTPADPRGSFGKLINGGKILFLGAPLSKNTFVHCLEEMALVPDRFTEHIFKFYTKTEDGSLIEFNMPRHFNANCPHISDNYEKLLPIMLNKGAATKVKILASTSYLVDAKKCAEIVFRILKKDIHAFDDLRDINED